MKTANLTQEQQKQLIDYVAEICDTYEDDVLETIVDISDDFYFIVTGQIDVTGHREDDRHCGYMNGTGAWVEDYRHGSLSITTYDNKGNECALEKELKTKLDHKMLF